MMKGIVYLLLFSWDDTSFCHFLIGDTSMLMSSYFPNIFIYHTWTKGNTPRLYSKWRDQYKNKDCVGNIKCNLYNGLIYKRCSYFLVLGKKTIDWRLAENCWALQGPIWKINFPKMFSNLQITRGLITFKWAVSGTHLLLRLPEKSVDFWVPPLVIEPIRKKQLKNKKDTV